MIKKTILAVATASFVLSLPGLAVTQQNNTLTSKSSFNTSYSDDLNTYNRRVAQELKDGIAEGKLIVPEYIKENIKELAAKGYCLHGYQLGGIKTYASKGLLDLLHSLITSNEVSRSNPLSILSFIRRGHNHGAIQANGDAICQAVDIDGYSGNKIHMNNPHNSLKAIIKVIENMPKGKYNIGLPRPGGGSSLDPSKDFFLPVNSLSQNERSPTGNLISDLKLIKNDEARDKISQAIFRNRKAKVVFLMPDAVDHLHVKSLEENQGY